MIRIIAGLLAVFLSFSASSISAQSRTLLNQLPIEQCKLMGKNVIGNTVRYEDSGLTEDWSQFVRPLGKVRVLMIAQDFPDVRAKSKFSKMKTFATSLESEFARLSNGRADFDITVRNGWLTMQNSAKHYMTVGWWEKIDDALELVDPEFDFRDFDMFIIKTDEKNTVVDVAGALPIWSSYKPDGLSVTRGVYLGSDFWTQDGGGVAIGVHEIGHLLGLPDLYPFNENGTRPVGLFDLMGSSGKGMLLRLMGWHDWKLGWLVDSEVKCLDPAKAQIFKVPSNSTKTSPFIFPISKTKAYVVENWKPYANKRAANWVAYTIDSSMHVWSSAGIEDIGKYSPIQVLTPDGVKRSKDWGARNPELALRLGQSLTTEIGVFKFIKSGKDLTMRFVPKPKK